MSFSVTKVLPQGYEELDATLRSWTQIASNNPNASDVRTECELLSNVLPSSPDFPLHPSSAVYTCIDDVAGKIRGILYVTETGSSSLELRNLVVNPQGAALSGVQKALQEIFSRIGESHKTNGGKLVDHLQYDVSHLVPREDLREGKSSTRLRREVREASWTAPSSPLFEALNDWERKFGECVR